MDGVPPESIQEMLAAEHVQCAVRGGNLRFAPHVYNTIDEIDRLFDLLPAKSC